MSGSWQVSLPVFSGKLHWQIAVYLSWMAGSCHSDAALQSPTGSLALFRHPVEGLRNALEGVSICGLGAAPRLALDHQVGSLAHGVHHLRLFRCILYPGAVVLRVHGIGCRADRRGGVVARFLWIADDHRYLVFHLLRRPRRYEGICRIAVAAGRFRGGRTWL